MDSSTCRRRSCAALVPFVASLALSGVAAAQSDQPDLVIQQVRVTGPEQASLGVSITVRNVGRAPADPFRTDVFMTTPRRWPLLFTLCPLTRAQQAAGGSAPCGSPFTVDPLPPGQSVSYDAYITWPVDHASGARETVEFMADGCFAALEPSLPAYCRVDERNEANNTRSQTATVP